MTRYGTDWGDFGAIMWAYRNGVITASEARERLGTAGRNWESQEAAWAAGKKEKAALNPDLIQVESVMHTAERTRVVVQVPRDDAARLRTAMVKAGFFISALYMPPDPGHPLARIEGIMKRNDDGTYPIMSGEDFLRVMMAAWAPLSGGTVGTVVYPAAGTARAADAPRDCGIVVSDVHKAQLEEMKSRTGSRLGKAEPARPAEPEKTYGELRREYILHGGGIAEREAIAAKVTGTVDQDGMWTWSPSYEEQAANDPVSPLPHWMLRGPDGKFLMSKEAYLRSQGKLPAPRLLSRRAYVIASWMLVILVLAMIAGFVVDSGF